MVCWKALSQLEHDKMRRCQCIWRTNIRKVFTKYFSSDAMHSTNQFPSVSQDRRRTRLCARIEKQMIIMIQCVVFGVSLKFFPLTEKKRSGSECIFTCSSVMKRPEMFLRSFRTHCSPNIRRPWHEHIINTFPPLLLPVGSIHPAYMRGAADVTTERCSFFQLRKWSVFVPSLAQTVGYMLSDASERIHYLATLSMRRSILNALRWRTHTHNRQPPSSISTYAAPMPHHAKDVLCVCWRCVGWLHQRSTRISWYGSRFNRPIAASYESLRRSICGFIGYYMTH